MPLAGCASLLPIGEPASATDPGAAALLAESADAHGLAAFRTLGDLSVSYDGRWRPLIDRLQPVLVDRGHRRTSQERLLLAEGRIGQSHRGPAGTKHVRRDPDGVAVWFDGEASTDRDVLDAAALVADAYRLFLLGPLALAGRPLPMRRAGGETVDGAACELVDVWLRPGLGRVARDRLTLAIDRRTRRMRRLRFTLEGLRSTQGAVAKVDCFEFVERHGVAWPTRFHERLRRPIPGLPVHDWTLTGLDADRGLDAAMLGGPGFSGLAQVPAAPL
ncbi:hypothetical protein [Piscinibacter sakaiensis]|uniref:hypothetical protein n=1 Tax=Piscinibacter sakaiensis TaxID=1547922 RepID=UPI0012FCEF1F|nr:hypothetical protein [Piscinibacter sakaiensis]